MRAARLFVVLALAATGGCCAEAQQVVADVHDDVTSGPPLTRVGVAPRTGVDRLDTGIEAFDEVGGTIDDFLAHKATLVHTTHGTTMALAAESADT